MLDVQITPMINCDPDEDRAEESSEEECAQYDSGDDLTEATFVGLGGDTWKKKSSSSQRTFSRSHTKNSSSSQRNFSRSHTLEVCDFFQVGELSSS